MSVYLIPLALAFGVYWSASPWVDRNDSAVRTAFVWVTIGLIVRYLWWRATVGLAPFTWSLRGFYIYAYFGLEVGATIVTMRYRRFLTKVVYRSLDVDRLLGAAAPGPAALVDVLIPTYNEASDILERTVVGAQNQNHPNVRVWILDDGRRAEVADLAARMGVGYLTRADNAHYKAGNLNAALAKLDDSPGRRPRSEFIAILDADFVASPDFVSRTLALMALPRTGLVQTPQHFYNPDPFQYGLGSRADWPDEQRHWFDISLPSKDAHGAASCCGTSCLIRRACLDEIGGFPTDSISEDTLTTIRLRANGWQTLYLWEPLTAGLNPEGLQEFLVQRARWCLGGVQIALSKWGPLGGGIGLMPVLYLLEALLEWPLCCLFQYATILVPIVYWFTGVYVVRGSLAETLFYAGPVYGELLFINWIKRGVKLPIVGDSNLLIEGFVIPRATWRGIFRSRSVKFDVTDKGVSRDSVTIHWRQLRVFLALAIGLVAGLTYGWTGARHLNADWRAFNTFWSLYGIVVLIAACVPCIERPRRRRSERFPVAQLAVVRGSNGTGTHATVVDLSTEGALVRLPDHVYRTDVRTIELNGIGSIPCVVVRGASTNAVGLRLAAGPAQRAALIKLLYCSMAHLPLASEWHLGPALRRLVAWVLKVPALLRDAGRKVDSHA
jgi:cellulose synthase (UDP-forming)